jgi:hypothetical protein
MEIVESISSAGSQSTRIKTIMGKTELTLSHDQSTLELLKLFDHKEFLDHKNFFFHESSRII